MLKLIYLLIENNSSLTLSLIQLRVHLSHR